MGFVYRVVKFIALAILCVFSYADDSIFNRLDTSVNLNLGMGQKGNYSSLMPGINASLLKYNVWYSLDAVGVTNIQSPIFQSQQIISSGMNISGKVGYSIVLGQIVNLIPYVGLGYNNSTATLPVDSVPLFNYSFTNIDYSLGFRPEVALGSSVKLTLDTNITGEAQSQLLPNSLTTQAHVDTFNGYLITTPSVQWNPFANFNLGLYYQLPYMFTNNQSALNVISRGYSSQTVGNALVGPANVVGIYFGLLF